MKRQPRRNCKACGKEVKRAADTYCDNKCHKDYEWSVLLSKIVSMGRVENIHQARHLFKDQHFCLLCKNTVWCGSSMPLLIDHIDGNSENWSTKNLRKICPNCDALLPTYKGRNKHSGRAYRRARYAAGKSY